VVTILIHIRKKALQFYVIYSGKIETCYRGHSIEQQTWKHNNHHHK